MGLLTLSAFLAVPVMASPITANLNWSPNPVTGASTTATFGVATDADCPSTYSGTLTVVEPAPASGTAVLTVGSTTCGTVNLSAVYPTAAGFVGTKGLTQCGEYTATWAGTTTGAGVTFSVQDDFVVTCTPTITTAFSPTSPTAPGSSTDTATLAGTSTTPAPTGTITYFFGTGAAPATGTNPCSGGSASGTATVTAAGVQGASATKTGLVAGTYYWYAVYSGDSKNAGVTSACEPLTVRSTTGVPQFPLGMLALIGLMIPAMLVLRKYNGIYSPTV